jgi:hypothetical protein
MGEPKLLMMAPAPASVQQAMHASLAEAGLVHALGPHLFATVNWHQSLCTGFRDTPDLRRRLLLAGERMRADAITLTFDRVHATGDAAARHWALLPSDPAPFHALRATVHAALDAQDLVPEYHCTAHVTISYAAPAALPLTRIRPVTWTIDAIELVSPGRSPHRYRTLGRWALHQPAHPHADQLPLPV